jgi:tripartite-type tricarboxylate transporter receptor subunit TctC
MKGILVKSAIALGILAAVPQLAGSQAAMAQQWPTRPIKAIVPFPAGGGTDLMGRLVAKHLGDRLGQQVYVENIGGANGSIGTQAVMRAEPDGYTIGVISDGPMIVNPALYPNNAYVPLRDFAPVAMVNRFPSLLTAHPSTGIKTVADLIRVAKEKPGTLNYSSGGIGNFSHMGLELLAHQTGIKITHVPYRGIGPATQAILTGEVQLLYNNAGHHCQDHQGDGRVSPGPFREEIFQRAVHHRKLQEPGRVRRLREDRTHQVGRRGEEGRHQGAAVVPTRKCSRSNDVQSPSDRGTA